MRVGKRPGAGVKLNVPKMSTTSGSSRIVGANTRRQKLTSMPGTQTRVPGRRDYGKGPPDPVDKLTFGFGLTGLTGES